MRALNKGKRDRKSSIARVISALVMASASVGAEVYKWVDEAGRVHYGDTKPRDHRTHTIETAPAPAESEVLRARTRIDEVLEQQRSGREQKARREKEAGTADREAQRRNNRCRHARRDLAVLEMERPVFRLDEGGGRVYLEDGARATELERARASIRKYCR